MDGTKVEKFLDFVKKTLPNSKIDLKRLEDGKVSVSITSTGNNQATNDTRTSCQSRCYNYCQSKDWGCPGSTYSTCISKCLSQEV